MSSYLNDSTLSVDSGNIILNPQNHHWRDAVTRQTGSSIALSIGPQYESVTLEYYLMTLTDNTSVSLSFQDIYGTTQNIRFHDRIFWTSGSTYNYSNNATSINLTNNQNMGYRDWYSASAEYGMYLRLNVSPFSWQGVLHNFPRFYAEYWYISTSGTTYKGILNGGPHQLASSGANYQLHKPVITTSSNVEYSIFAPLS